MTKSSIHLNDMLIDRATTKKAIRKIITEWKERLGIKHWTVFVNFSRNGSMAECYAEPEYFKAYLNFFMKRVMEEVQTNYDLEELVVHELCHCLSWELVALTERLIENTEDETGELDTLVSRREEELVSAMSHGLVMAKYGLTEVPENVRFKGWEKKGENKKL
jgi:hypothetical protein